MTTRFIGFIFHFKESQKYYFSVKQNLMHRSTQNKKKKILPVLLP